MIIRAAISFLVLLLAYCWSETPAAAAPRAKGLFLEQIQQPTKKLNTGLSYWIELKRNGKLSRVDHRAAFKSGDRIRFHLTTNIDGYAYVVLVKGATGKQAVLFPGTGANQANKVVHGTGVVLPGKGSWLVFDKTPGKETLRLVLSRHSVNATAFLNKMSSRLTIASNLQPTLTNYVIDLGDSEAAAEADAVGKLPADDELASTDQMAGKAKDLFLEDSPAATKTRPPVSHTTSPRPIRKLVRRKVVRKASSVAPAAVTIVNTSPSEDLYADVVLDHN